MNRKQKKARLARIRGMEKIVAEKRRAEENVHRQRVLEWQANETAKHIWAELMREADRAIHRRNDRPATNAGDCW